MKKFIAIALSAVLAMSILAGCGSSGSNNATTAASKDEATTAAPAATTAADTAGNTDADFSADESKGSVEEQLKELTDKAAPGEYYGDLVTIACTNGPSTFDPFARGAGYGAQIPTFEKLAQADSTGAMKLNMLKSCVEVDELTYDCELWDFITDTAGNNITADDVAWSIQTYIDAGNQGGVAKLDNIEVTGEYTFIWHNSAAFGVGEKEKQFGNPSILSQKAYESDPDMMASNPVATGPYKLKEFMEGSYGIYEVNEDYWYNKIDDEEWLAENDGVWTYQNFKEIRCDVISDASARAIALENGSVDACTSMNATDVAGYANNPDITTINLPVTPPVSFYFNYSENSLCSNVYLRQAICYAIDNAGVAAGLDIPAYPVYGIQPRMYDAPEEWTTGREYYDYNIEKAKECLEKAGYNGETLTVIYDDNDQRNPSWILMQAMLRDAGINVELKMLEMATMDTTRVDFTAWDILSETMGGGNYLPNTIKKWWTVEQMKTLNGLNVGGVADAELDRLYEDVLNIHDDASIEAWDQYFTYDNCLGYAVCCIFNQTACSSKIVPVIFGSQSQLMPGAFKAAE